ncbi:hypothetical protein [Alicyclobacillus vulcanalis]|uniref:Uncharacterized protein n=1 Tax=Alicyclobacillus vulcanalis TaxID=252246 RepID=A0A1N7LW37_9BACL|nr:hypothetical protein SAMN05421799_10424 [Alicyclobacillus vulcanalis]
MARIPQTKTLVGSVALVSTFLACGGVAFAAVDQASQTSSGEAQHERPDAHRKLLLELRKDLFSTAAQDLKLTPAQLREQLRSGKTLAEIASAQGVSTSTLTSDLENKLASDVQADVAQGSLTAQQASRLESRLDTAIQAFVKGEVPKGWDKVRPRGWDFARRDLLSVAAKDLNLSTSTLIQDLRDGKTLAELAASQGVSTSTLVSDLEQAAEQDVQKAVADGKITSSRAQTLESHLDTWISDWVNGTLPRPSGAHMPGAQPTSTSTGTNA